MLLLLASGSIYNPYDFYSRRTTKQVVYQNDVRINEIIFYSFLPNISFSTTVSPLKMYNITPLYQFLLQGKRLSAFSPLQCVVSM